MKIRPRVLEKSNKNIKTKTQESEKKILRRKTLKIIEKNKQKNNNNVFRWRLKTLIITENA